MTNKQKGVLARVNYFVPENISDWSKIPESSLELPLYRGKPIIESKDGIEPVEAFFSITERGKPPEKVTNLRELSRLLWGQRWMATHIEMWKDGKKEKILFRSDFNEEPEYIQKMVDKLIFS